MKALRPLARRPELIPGILMVGLFTLWAASEGGYAPTTWYPGALFVLGLLCVAGYAYRNQLTEVSTPARIALVLLAGFVVWSFLSITWAGVQGIALDGANRTLLYLLVYALFSVVVWRAETAALVLGLYAVGIGVVAFTVVSGAAGPEAELTVRSGRLLEPTGYPNAVAALCVGGLWPALFLAGRRETPWAARGLMLATAGVLVQVAMLAQSRGAIIVFPLALLIYMAVVPNRLRAFLAVALVGGASLLAAPAVLDVFTIAESGGSIQGALEAAYSAITVSFVALLVLGTLLAFADSRIEIPERTARRAGWAGGAVAGVAAVVGAVAIISVIGNPVSWAGDRWEDLKGGYDSSGFGTTSRFSGDLGSNRYDFWRVAIEEQFAAEPLVGDGADNFATTYVLHRESSEEPLYPHSLPIRILAGTGIVGGILFGGFVVAAVVGAAAVRRRAGTQLGKGVAAVALASLAYWGLHGLGDWLWSFPALSAPIFAWLAMAASLRRSARAGEAEVATRALGRSRRMVPAIVAGALALLAAVALALPWGAARDVEVASGSWGANPEAAFERLNRARDLNFLSAGADLAAGQIAVELGDTERARESFARALEREPTNWYALLELGAIEVLEGDREAGIEYLERARTLNPGDPLIRQVLRRADEGRPLQLDEITRLLLERVCSVVGTTRDTRFCE